MPKQFALNLLGEFAVYRDMEPLALPPSCRRVVALAAVKRRELHRDWICATLWPSSTPAKAVASLRSALWRLRPLGADPLLNVNRHYVALAPEVWVDWHEAIGLINRLPAQTAGSDPALRRLLRGGDLLDGWTESWCAAERARYRACRERTALRGLTDPSR
ncbi:AfsR/SARP family transcriptional regulator [Mycolicibacterium sp. XJ870]